MSRRVAHPSQWTVGGAYAHCKGTFDANLRRFPDLLERYTVALVEAETDDERLRIMRRALAETFQRRYPLAQPHALTVEIAP